MFVAATGGPPGNRSPHPCQSGWSVEGSSPAPHTWNKQISETDEGRLAGSVDPSESEAQESLGDIGPWDAGVRRSGLAGRDTKESKPITCHMWNRPLFEDIFSLSI
jgi:hypothetical protein